MGGAAFHRCHTGIWGAASLREAAWSAAVTSPQPPPHPTLPSLNLCRHKHRVEHSLLPTLSPIPLYFPCNPLPSCRHRPGLHLWEPAAAAQAQLRGEAPTRVTTHTSCSVCRVKAGTAASPLALGTLLRRHPGALVWERAAAQQPRLPPGGMQLPAEGGAATPQAHLLRLLGGRARPQLPACGMALATRLQVCGHAWVGQESV